MQPPKARQETAVLMGSTGEARKDPYFWMRDMTDEVLEHLKEENAYTESQISREDVELLAKELKDRDPQDDDSVPYTYRGYTYHSRIKEGWEYPVLYRRKVGEREVQVLLDQNKSEVAASLTKWDVQGDRFCYLLDYLGDRMNALFLRDLSNDQEIPVPDDPRMSSVADAIFLPGTEEKEMLLVIRHPETFQCFEVVRWDMLKDTLETVYREESPELELGIGVSADEEFVFITKDHGENSQYFLYVEGEMLALYAPEEMRVVLDHSDVGWVMISNRNHPNYTVEVGHDLHALETVVEPKEGEILTGFQCFKEYLVVESHQEGLPGLRVWSAVGWATVNFEVEAYDMWLEDNVEYDTHLLRYGFSSMREAPKVCSLDMRTMEVTVLKADKFLDHNPEDYEMERIHVRSGDVEVPVSLVTPQDEGRAVYIVGYGAYGLRYESTLGATDISLLQRGVSVAIAHVRGGLEKGYEWYEDGKMEHKKHTFEDFIAVAEYFRGQGYDRIYIEGRSAGGLLMGAVLNARPDLFRGVVMGVPFVDVLTTMEDESLPLTAGEWVEWGDPREPEQYGWMREYCPYTNLEDRAYPPVYISGNLHDSQVLYHEPMKFASRLRDHSPSPVYLRMGMDKGHSGSSKRSEGYQEHAEKLAFILNLEAQYVEEEDSI